MKIAVVGTVASSLLGFRRGLIQYMILQNQEVYAFYSEGSEEQKKGLIQLGCTPIKYEMSRSGFNIFKDFQSIMQLKRLFNIHEIDIVFSYFTKSVIFCALAVEKAHISRNVGMIEGLGYVFTDLPNRDPLKKKILKRILVFLYSLIGTKIDLMVFLNNDDPNDLINKYGITLPEYKILGPIGVDLNKFYKGKPCLDRIKFIFIGRMLLEKGIHEFISAAKVLKAKYSNVEFIALGGIEKKAGSLTENELKRLAEKEIITYPGFVNNVEEWLRESSVYVLPSYYREGVPRSTQEAMSIGLPIVTTNVPGCKETVVDGLNGFLVPKWDSVALIKALEYFLLNPNEISVMGNESRKIAEKKYDEKDINMRLYNMIIGN